MLYAGGRAQVQLARSTQNCKHVLQRTVLSKLSRKVQAIPMDDKEFVASAPPFQPPKLQ